MLEIELVYYWANKMEIHLAVEREKKLVHLMVHCWVTQMVGQLECQLVVQWVALMVKWLVHYSDSHWAVLLVH